MHNPFNLLARTGRSTTAAVSELGYQASLLAESVVWICAGGLRSQPVRAHQVVAQMVVTGLQAIPIVAVLAMVIGLMLAIQGIHTLRAFGAESQVVVGIALAVTREFAPLITGILVAGRSGSALAAQVGSMRISQEIDALRVLGVHPVRHLVAPPLLAMLVMLPCLTILADVLGLLGGGLFCNLELGMSLRSYTERVREVLDVSDVLQSVLKSLLFAVIVTLVGVSNGFAVTGGAEGVGRATTRAVVQSISYIIVADMLFTLFVNR
ncbi:MAG: ABC transporter permease [Gammaproteobacteria bacterium]|nr:ABC transporter permease [Gammaproteobacteria bacterium]